MGGTTKKIKIKAAAIVSALLLMLAASFGITYAYLISDDSKVNEFTVGENTIKINEEYNPPEKLIPGAEIEKNPSVENTGNLACFVRIRADFSDSKMKDVCVIYYNDAGVQKEGINPNWEYNSSDGYYYYKKILQPGDKTPSLFDVVKIKEDAQQSEFTEFDIYVYAESRGAEDGDNDNDYKRIWEREVKS